MNAPEVIPLHRVPTDLPRLLGGAIEVLQRQAASLDVALTIEAPPNLPLVTVDPHKIAWAVTTLVGNSLRYVRRGTQLHPGGAIHVRIDVERGWAVITVSDDGPGIPPAKVRHLFHRENGILHGAALALLLIQDVIGAHGGTVDVESQHGSLESGTTVRLRLPCSGAVPS